MNTFLFLYIGLFYVQALSGMTGEDPRMALIPGIPVYSNCYGNKCDLF
jgi:hypothetical protein